MKRNALGLLICLCIGHGSVACDRSWRDEQFSPPGEGFNDTQERPRVRPPVASTTGSQFSNVGSSAASGGVSGGEPTENIADAGVDASTLPGHTGGEDSVGTTSPTGSGQGSGPSIDGGGEDVDTSGIVTTTADSDDTQAPVVFSKAALLAAAAECALDQNEAFAEKAVELQQALEALTEQPNQLTEAQQAFVSAMSAFQIVEQFRVGPAARSGDPGGLELRDQIYSYPQINRCQIDRNLVSQVYADEFSKVLLNARGLGAIEYLLFARGDDNSCSVGIDINTRGTWADLSQEELDARRAAYALAIAQDVVTRAHQLVDAWLPNEGNFVASLAQAGSGSKVFTSQQAALNALSHALFYVEKEVKDYKLGWPLGLVAECVSGSCPGASELPFSGQSGPSIAQNLRGFRLLFEGCGAGYAGLGFDDWLKATDPEGDLGERMLSRLADAESVAANLPRLLEDAFYDAPDEARALHAAVKSVTDLLKTEFVTVLNLDLPLTAEGDND